MSTSPLSESQVGGGLFDQLPVPADATTSRVVVSNPLLRVVAFAMDAGQELTEHASSRAVVVQMVEGSVEFTVGASGVTTVVAATSSTLRRVSAMRWSPRRRRASPSRWSRLASSTER